MTIIACGKLGCPRWWPQDTKGSGACLLKCPTCGSRTYAISASPGYAPVSPDGRDFLGIQNILSWGNTEETAGHDPPDFVCFIGTGSNEVSFAADFSELRKLAYAHEPIDSAVRPYVTLDRSAYQEAD